MGYKAESSSERLLRIRDAEVRDLQLLLKYFSSRPPEKTATLEMLEPAEIAEKLRGKCSWLVDQAEKARSERDILQAEMRQKGYGRSEASSSTASLLLGS